MNTTHLTRAELTKALSDAAEYNLIKAQVKRDKTCAQTHMDFATKLKTELKRLQGGSGV